MIEQLSASFLFLCVGVGFLGFACWITDLCKDGVRWRELQAREEAVRRKEWQ
jgi:hypothetical protein